MFVNQEMQEKADAIKISDDSVSFGGDITQRLKETLFPKFEEDLENLLEQRNVSSIHDMAGIYKWLARATVYGWSNLGQEMHVLLRSKSQKGIQDINKKGKSPLSQKRIEGVNWKGYPVHFSTHFGQKKTLSFYVKGSGNRRWQ